MYKRQGEGHAQFPNIDSKDTLTHNGQVALRYVDNRVNVTEAYPANPNGSVDGITSVCSADGRITMMMPHPERVYRGVQHTWKRGLAEDSPWMQLFYNAHHWVNQV